MSVRITAKNDFSFLFQNSSSVNGSTANLNFLSDYASIKNGSYGKLMKAYYGMNSSSEETSIAKNTNIKDTANALTSMQSTTDHLKESADALLVKGDKSVFTDDKLTENTYQAVSKFVSDYNSVLTASEQISNTTILNRTLNMTNITASNQDLLEKVGITINSDNSLTLDQKTFMAADLTTVKGLFNTTGAYAYRISAQSSLINYATDNQIAKANTYTIDGTYGKNNATGNLFDSIF